MDEIAWWNQPAGPVVDVILHAVVGPTYPESSLREDLAGVLSGHGLGLDTLVKDVPLAAWEEAKVWLDDEQERALTQLLDGYLPLADLTVGGLLGQLGGRTPPSTNGESPGIPEGWLGLLVLDPQVPWQEIFPWLTVAQRDALRDRTSYLDAALREYAEYEQEYRALGAFLLAHADEMQPELVTQIRERLGPNPAALLGLPSDLWVLIVNAVSAPSLTTLVHLSRVNRQLYLMLENAVALRREEEVAKATELWQKYDRREEVKPTSPKPVRVVTTQQALEEALNDRFLNRDIEISGSGPFAIEHDLEASGVRIRAIGNAHFTTINTNRSFTAYDHVTIDIFTGDTIFAAFDHVTIGEVAGTTTLLLHGHATVGTFRSTNYCLARGDVGITHLGVSNHIFLRENVTVEHIFSGNIEAKEDVVIKSFTNGTLRAQDQVKIQKVTAGRLHISGNVTAFVDLPADQIDVLRNNGHVEYVRWPDTSWVLISGPDNNPIPKTATVTVLGEPAR